VVGDPDRKQLTAEGALLQRPIERRSSLFLRLIATILFVAIAPELIFVLLSLASKNSWAFVGLRHSLLRLALVTAPMAILLALWTGRRLVRPIEHLRRQALEKAAAESPRAVLDPERRDEVGVLADAFNVLLLALDKKRTDNQAFVAELVHEFKNPVAAVRACADTLQTTSLDHERATRLARVLHDSAGKLDQLVTHFLELARAEAGMPNEERSTVDVAVLTCALVDRMRDDTRYGALHFRFEGPLDAKSPLLVVGVQHRLDALFRELLDNGASFAKDGGTVSLSVASSDGQVHVVVKDDGPGILPEDLARVFERFFTRREGERRGTGLGLALVRAVAEAHGGSVVASSRPGEGASFEVRLPRA
jgi:two-component system sensor histidine kinase ChvG